MALKLVQAPSPYIQLESVCKSFGKVQANKMVSLDFFPGRIKALLGENGAGKSTLMSILAGRLQPDKGCIFIKDKPVHFRSPKDALRAGIGMVYQHFKLVDSLSVAENILLGQEKGFYLSPEKMYAKVAELAGKYAISVNPKARVADLSMGERQLVEILKLLHRDSSLLIFDEPTAVLTPPETEYLFKTIRHMALRGKSIIFISHKLGEVLEIADEIALMRLGEVVDEFDVGLAPDREQLAERMIGRSVDLDLKKLEIPVKDELLKVENLPSAFEEEVSFSVSQGEVFAIVGVAGNGQRALVDILAGLKKMPGGRVEILGQSLEAYYAKPPIKNGLAYIPEDRQGLAVCLDLPLVDNLILTARQLFTKGWKISRAQALEATKEIIKNYDVRPGDPLGSARSLSGGNLQKFVIGREFLREPSLIIAENPTQGLDIAATEDVWHRLLKAREKAGILLLTGDVAEAMQLADKVAVMYRGRLVDVFSVKDTEKVASIGAMMAGVKG